MSARYYSMFGESVDKVAGAVYYWRVAGCGGFYCHHARACLKCLWCSVGILLATSLSLG